MTDLDKMLADMESEETVEGTPKEERGAVKESLTNFGTGFVDSFKDDPLDTTSKFLEAAVPSTVKDEVDMVTDTVKEVKGIYDKNVNEIKTTGKKTIDLIKNKVPVGSKFRDVLNKLSSRLGDDDPDRANVNNGPSEDDIISDKIAHVFAKERKLQQVSEIIKESKEDERSELTTTLLADILGNTRYANTFRNTASDAYYRKSLELKLKHLLVSKKHFELTKLGFDTFKNQLEAVVHNTGLPDLVKLRNSEQLKETMQHRFRENVADVFYSATNPLQVFKENLIKKVGDSVTGFKDGLTQGSEMLEMMESLSDSGIEINKSEYAGAEAGKWLRDFVGNKVGDAANENDYVRDKLHKFKMGMSDPKETLREMADERYEKGGFINGKLSSILRSMSSLGTQATGDTVYRELDPDQPAPLTLRTTNTINKVIPELLSRIWVEARMIRTGSTEEPDGLYYSYDSSSIDSKGNIKDSIVKNVSRALKTSAGYNLDRLTGVVKKEGDLDDEEAEKDFKRALFSHLLKDGSMSPAALVKDEFINLLDKENQEKVREALTKTLEASKEDLTLVDEMKDGMLKVKSNTPLIDKQIEEFYNNGQMEEMHKLGLVDFDETNKIYRINREAYINLIHTALETQLDTDEETITESKENISSVKDTIKDLKEEDNSFDKEKVTEEIEERLNSFYKKEYKATIEKKVEETKDIMGKTYEDKLKDKVDNIKKTIEEEYQNTIEGKVEDAKASVKELYENKLKEKTETLKKEMKENIEKAKTKEGREDIFNSVEDSMFSSRKNIEAVLDKVEVKDLTRDKLIDHMSNLDSRPDTRPINKVNEALGKINRESVSSIIEEKVIGVDELFEAYNNTGSQFTGIDFESWASNLNFKRFGNHFVKDTEEVDRVAKAKEEVSSRIKSKFPKLSVNILDELRNKDGKITLWSILKKTREWDRKMFKSIPGLIGKTIKGVFKLPGFISNKLKGSVPDNVKDNVEGFFKKTRETDREIMKNTPGYIGGLFSKLFSSAKDAASTVKEGSVFNSVKDFFNKKKVFGDTDGDGIRDGSWKEQFNEEKPKEEKKNNIPKDKKEETKSKDGMLSSILGYIKNFAPLLGVMASGITSLLGPVKSLLGLGGKAVSGVAKGAATMAAGGTVLKDKMKPKTTSKPKVKQGKIMSTLRSLKGKIFKKFGSKAGGKIVARLTAKIGSRLIPGIGTALLAYDAAMVTRYMIGGMSLIGAVSKQVLGFNIEDDTDPVVDDNGEPVDISKDLEKEAPKLNIIEKEETKSRVIDNTFRKVSSLARKDYTKPVGRFIDKTGNFLDRGSFKPTASRKEVFNLLDDVSKKTGVDANILKTFAAVESGFDPNAEAKTSNAKGLFQFIPSTWKEMLNKYGKKHGLSKFTSPLDPEANALMGAEFLKENKEYLEGLNGNANVTDLYLAHFLGRGGAKKLLNSRTDMPAASILPRAANANKSIFFKEDGTPRTTGELYSLMENKLKNKSKQFGFKRDKPTTNEKSDAILRNMEYSYNSYRGDINQRLQQESLTRPYKEEKVSVVSKATEAVESKTNLEYTNVISEGLEDITDVLLKSYDVQSKSLEVQLEISKKLDKLDNLTLPNVTESKELPKQESKPIDTPKPPIELKKKRFKVS